MQQTAARTLVSLLLATIGANAANAQWGVTNLYPVDDTLSEAPSVFGSQQVGSFYINGASHAILWSGTAESWIDLTPANSSGAAAHGVSDGQQVGYANFPNPGTFDLTHAGLWSSTSASFVDLAPANAVASQAWGLGDGQQVGEVVQEDGRLRASLWSGSAASWIDLSPAGTSWSQAYGASAGQQVGIVGVDNIPHASLWTGTAASWIDLSPPDSGESEALGVNQGQQVGRVRVAVEGVPFAVNHASLWTGTAASWVDLNPPGSIESNAYAVFHGQQVGDANIDGMLRAVLWNGTAESWVDLNTFLPDGFDYSSATGIWSDASVTYVSGYGGSRQTGSQYALLWTLPVPEPNAAPYLALGGLLVAGRRHRITRRLEH